MPEWRYVCEVCGHEESIETDAWRCPVCGGAFGIEGPNRLEPDAIDAHAPGLWRYRSVLPVDVEQAHWLGEGMTPLVEGRLAGRAVRFKLDGLLPTGSFKDRGAAVLVAHLRRIGRNRLIVDSSGNAAAAMAGNNKAKVKLVAKILHRLPVRTEQAQNRLVLRLNHYCLNRLKIGSASAGRL